MPFEPTSEQAEICVGAVDRGESALVVAGPGTGKSVTALSAAKRKLAACAGDSSRHVVFLSFSNAAVRRLAREAQLEFTSAERARLRFCTYHALAAEVLIAYGRFAGLPPAWRVIDNLELELLEMERRVPPANERIAADMLHLARAEGLVAFDVLLELAASVLERSRTLREIWQGSVALVVADEFQDTSPDQWRLLKLIGSESQVMAFADPDQIIYGQLHQASKERLLQFQAWKGLPAARGLSINYRCASAGILRCAGALLAGTPYVEADADGVQFFPLSGRNQVRAHVAVIWRELVRQLPPQGTIGILAPSNKLVEETVMALRAPPAGSTVPFPVFVEMVRDDASFDSVKLATLACREAVLRDSPDSWRVAAHAVRAMDKTWNSRRGVSATGLDRLAGQLAQAARDPLSAFGRVAMRMRSEPELNKLVVELVMSLEQLSEGLSATTVQRIPAYRGLQREPIVAAQGELDLFTDARRTRVPRSMFGEDLGSYRVQAMTYHRAKGREFDCVVMLVDPRAESSRVPLEEKRRLYYVCATRAKQWIGILHFRNDPGPVLGAALPASQA